MSNWAEKQLWLSQFPEIPAAIWRDLSLGSLLETLIVIVFAYQALKMIEATRTSLINNHQGSMDTVTCMDFPWSLPDWHPISRSDTDTGWGGLAYYMGRSIYSSRMNL